MEVEVSAPDALTCIKSLVSATVLQVISSAIDAAKRSLFSHCHRKPQMHFVVSATYGPTDPTRAMLPFIFAASAVQSGDHVTLMLFADSVLTAVEGAGARLVPVGPPNRYEEIAGHPRHADGLQALYGSTWSERRRSRQAHQACRYERISCRGKAIRRARGKLLAPGTPSGS
jgi:hypothetical protein